MIRTHAFTYGDATVTVREPKGIDRIDQRVIYGKLAYNRTSDRDTNRAVNFAEFVARTVSVDGELGFPWATVDSNAIDMQKAFDGWQEWPSDLMDAWAGALYSVSESIAELEFQADVDPNA